MKRLDLLIIGLLFSSLSYAEPTWYCENGDPSGRGPLATVEKIGPNDFEIHVDYNSHDMDSSSRSVKFNFAGVPKSINEVSEQGMKCTRYSFMAARGPRIVQLFLCEDVEVSLIKLLNFSSSAPEYELSCQ